MSGSLIDHLFLQNVRITQFKGEFPALIYTPVQEAIDRLDVYVIPIPNRYPVETIVIQSKESVEGHKPVCLTIPHGGPHASNVTSFTPGVLAYALEGCESISPPYLSFI